VIYNGTENFVLSFVISEGCSLHIANVIFNGHLHVANIAVTYSEGDSIEQNLSEMVREAFSLANVEEDAELINTTVTPVEIQNRVAETFAKGNVLVVGDSGANSSPLAGAGGSIGVTTVPYAVEQIAKSGPAEEAIHTFNMIGTASAQKWIEKSASIKRYIESLHKESLKMKEAL
jgi:hypothetical protein